jgi:serine/threonine-protein kinase
MVLSPSWPAIWMIFYSVLVPTPPRRALLGMLGSASAAPVVIGFSLQHAGLHPMTPFHFFLMHVLPYLICVMLAYGATRTVYKLGTAVTRARELGSYRLTERLGRRRHGEVWRASHHLLAREAAIKFIRPESIAGAGREQASGMLKRFELEARATASLTSAHTIDIYDFGVTDDGAFYYAMELLEGLDADRLVRIFGPLPAARVIHIASQVCESLEEAHARGLVHRDMKPANVYVCRNGSRLDFVKVLDFGLVAQHRVAAQDPRLTLPEQMIGTPDFMPPEVALGRGIDGRADLYGLGCVAYWLVTGKPVFEGASYYEVVSKHIQQPPDAPSKHATGVPAELDRLILQCLEKDPARRPAGAREIRHRLIEIAREWPWTEEQAEAWWAENLPNGTPGVAGSALATPGSPVAVAAATPSRAPTLALRTRSGDRPGPDRP